MGATWRVLVVDDSGEVRAAVRTLLEDGGFEVAETADDDEAADLAAMTKPDIVLLDWLFDGKRRGAVALASLRRRAPEVPVVVYTAYPDDATASAAELGAAAVVTKDIGQSADLPAVLRKVIDEWRDRGAP